MSYQRISDLNAVKYTKSFTLVEILLSLSLGTVLLFILAKSYSDFYYTQTKQRELFDLQQYTHQLLDYFKQHIQHIGYQGKDRKESNYELFLSKGKTYHLSNPQCFVFIYDVNGDGCIGSGKKQQCQINGLNNTNEVNKEIFGFNLRNKNLSLFNEDLTNCYRNQCQNWGRSCELIKWKNMVDLPNYTIEKLNFRLLAKESIMIVELTLGSIKFPKIQYSATAYNYIFNLNE